MNPSFTGVIQSRAIIAILAAVIQNAAPVTGTELFTDGAMSRVQITIDADDVAALRSNPRNPVPALVQDGTNVYTNVSVHLKGSKGSFRPFDDKPALTLDFSRFSPGQKFHGLRKIHLNNSVEDPSLLNEQLGGEIFRSAGIPAPRVSHAHVVLNSRDVGLYVLIEGFSEDFLASHFRTVGAGLYEPANGRDIEFGMGRNSVRKGREDDDSALKALGRAALNPDLAQRWQQLQQSLDTDQFITYMAMEVALCHRDGYSVARNNYRLYHDVDSGKMVFLPHGMDQLFGEADFPWEPAMAGTVAKAIMETPEGRARYEALFPQLVTKHFIAQDLTNRVNDLVQRLRPALEPQEYSRLQREAAVVCERISARWTDLNRQLSKPSLQHLAFNGDVAALNTWEPVDPPAGGKMELIQLNDGIQALYIKAGPSTMASWRTKWLLQKGHYRLVGNARVTGFQPLPYGSHHGAGFRTVGSPRLAPGLTNSPAWSPLDAEFQIDGPVSPIEFVLEFRASAGEAWFDVGSMKVKQIE